MWIYPAKSYVWKEACFYFWAKTEKAFVLNCEISEYGELMRVIYLGEIRTIITTKWSGQKNDFTIP